MNKEQTLEDLYEYRYNWIPDNLKEGIGHFNVFQLDDFIGKNPKPLSFNRRIYFKITLIFGKSRLHYADKVIDIKKQALVFSNPQIPYSWESIDDKQSGFFCVFTESFFKQFGKLTDYPIFQPNGNRVFELTDDQADIFKHIFREMFNEINSNYPYKYDVLRNLAFEAIHKAMKSQPLQLPETSVSNGSERISSLFMELLERQFPIENTNQRIVLRFASEYANRLNIHVNHLNRALKDNVKLSTKEIIANRITQEAKLLLKYTTWNISQIGYCLGFEDVSNFSLFFKKNTELSPSQFRKK
ncbi:AraC family transcriptional regulator [Tenacibaculum adriaticum]|uniref:AraC family transcriptional regulator n=1 Tax=Tenacibaculum adriaticum TaxID=413713 RepID=A0A5S5DW94_9FLAO|nr:helix-turn-helix domain-containing protein [Tenacibaculum adriaticum]TYQ00184.1 AraC family transcriptional regulator [Tenacibaculum adriaticum]